MFEGGGMRAHVFPMEPADAGRWKATIAVDFPVPTDVTEKNDTRREFGVVLQRGSEVVHTFHRTITFGGSAGGHERRVTFLEPAVIKPGRYTIHAVLADPSSETPFAAEAEVVVPEIPKKRPFLVGPILGRRRGEDVVVFGGGTDRVGTATDFRPLLVAETERATPLAALTQACIVKPSRSDGPWIAERSLLADSNETVVSMPGIQLARQGKSPVVCRMVFDELPLGTLPLGRYTFQATLAGVDSTLVDDGTKRVPIALVGDAP
jgi:hypothetical protein